MKKRNRIKRVLMADGDWPEWASLGRDGRRYLRSLADVRATPACRRAYWGYGVTVERADGTREQRVVTA
jgi:hypothetical protein